MLRAHKLSESLQIYSEVGTSRASRTHEYDQIDAAFNRAPDVRWSESPEGATPLAPYTGYDLMGLERLFA